MTTLSARAAERQQARQASSTPAAPAPAPDKAQKLASIREDAKRRVAAAWTIAKTLLPSASPKAQQHLAAAMVQAPTAILGETMRVVATLNYAAQGAAKFAKETGRELNEFVEDEGLVSKLKTEVLGELKADDPVKTAAQGKKADEMPAGLAEEKPEAPAPAEPAAAGTPEDVPPAPEGEFQDAGMGGDAAPGDLGDGGMGVDPAAPANEAADAATEGSLMDSIEAVEREIQGLEGEVTEAGEEALDLAAIFNPEVQADKAQNLANEGDMDMDLTTPGDEFGPTGTEDMANSADFGGGQAEMTDADFFKGASGPDPLAALLGKQAGQSDVDTNPGEMDAYFETDLSGDTRDAESDHADDLLTEVLMDLEQPDMQQKRDTEPKFETPEAPQALKREAGIVSRPQSQIQKEKLAELKKKRDGLVAQRTIPEAPKKSSIRTVGNPTSGQGKQAAQGDGLTNDAIAALVLREDF